MTTPRSLSKKSFPLTGREWFAQNPKVPLFLSDHVASPDLCYDLLRAGVNADYNFLYAPSNDSPAQTFLRLRDQQEILARYCRTFPAPSLLPIPAWTSAELGQLLPQSVNVPYKNGRPQLYQRFNSQGYQHQISYYASSRHRERFIAATEADARAKALLWVLAHGRFPIPEGAQ